MIPPTWYWDPLGKAVNEAKQAGRAVEPMAYSIPRRDCFMQYGAREFCNTDLPGYVVVTYNFETNSMVVDLELLLEQPKVKELLP